MLYARKSPKHLAVVVTLMLAPEGQCAGDQRVLDPEDRSGQWSIGMANSWQDSVYAGVGVVGDFMPTFAHSGQRFFLETREFGWHLVDSSHWQLDLSGRHPSQGYNKLRLELDNLSVSDEGLLFGMERNDAFELDMELTRKTKWGRFGLEISQDVSDTHGGGEVAAKWAKVLRGNRLQLEPWVEFRQLSKEKANYYFGVDDREMTAVRPAYMPGTSNEWSLGLAARYQIADQHHVNINTAYRSLGDSIANSPIVADTGSFSVEVGYRYELRESDVSPREGDFNFFGNNGNATSLRLAYGCTAESSFHEILTGSTACADVDTHLASLFAARRVSSDVFSLPLEAWLQGGLARRLEHDLQDDIWEGVFAFKLLYRQFPWSDRVATRMGLSEGVSYAAGIPAREQERPENERRRSRFLAYLEFSVDVSVGDVFGVDSLRNCFAGFYIHHRSGIFETADVYNNVDGGSNANMFYLEWEFP